MGEDFFGELERRCRLPAVISRPALLRALGKVGLTAETVAADNLARALEPLTFTLRVYHDEQTAAVILRQLQELADR